MARKRRPNHFWIVEYWSNDLKRWEPAAFGHSQVKVFAEIAISSAKRKVPKAVYRATRYVSTRKVGA